MPNREIFTVAGSGGGIPATLQVASASTAPAVLLLHGTASSRDEVGGMYTSLAEALAARGVSSLRIDFAGCGDSTRAETDFTVESELADARTALDWLREDSRFDADRIGVLGFSQGGMIATLLAGDDPRIAALASWSSGIVEGGAFSALAPVFEQAGDDSNSVTLDLGFRTFTFATEWFRQAQSMALAAAIGRYEHPLLAVACSADDVVPPEASLELIRNAASADIEFRMLAGGDHVFAALDADSLLPGTVIELTTEWFASRLSASSASPRSRAST